MRFKRLGAASDEAGVILAWRRASAVGVVLLGVFLMSGCGSARRDGVKVRAAPGASRADAYIRITRRAVRAYAVVARRAETELNRSFNTCPVVQPRTALRQLPAEARFALLDRAAIAKAFFPSYLDFATRLAAVQTDDPVLRSARAAVNVLSRYYAPLLHSRPDYCRVLTDWKKVGWRPSFNVGRSIGASILLRAEPKEIQSARATIARARIRLRFAGVTSSDSRMFFQIANLPGSTRVQVTE